MQEMSYGGGRICIQTEIAWHGIWLNTSPGIWKWMGGWLWWWLRMSLCSVSLWGDDQSIVRSRYITNSSTPPSPATTTSLTAAMLLTVKALSLSSVPKHSELKKLDYVVSSSGIMWKSAPSWNSRRSTASLPRLGTMCIGQWCDRILFELRLRVRRGKICTAIY